MRRKRIKYYENYEISTEGCVYNIKTKRMLKQHENKGYLGVYIYNKKGRKHFLVHRLVAIHFLENKNDLPQVNHKDENKTNNNVENLEWCSPSYNVNYGTARKRALQSKIENGNLYGRKHSKEARKKMSLSKLGKPSKRKKTILIDGIMYESVTEAMEKLNLSTRKIYKLIEIENKKENKND